MLFMSYARQCIYGIKNTSLARRKSIGGTYRFASGLPVCIPQNLIRNVRGQWNICMKNPKHCCKCQSINSYSGFS